MAAVSIPAGRFDRAQLRKTVRKLLRRDLRIGFCFKGRKARRIRNLSAVRQRIQRSFPRCVTASAELLADMRSFQTEPVVQRIQQRRFSDAGIARKRTDFSLQHPVNLLNARRILIIGKQHGKARFPVDCRIALRVREVELGKYQHRPDLLIHADRKKPVQQQQIRCGIAHGKHKQQLVEIGQRRPDQQILPRMDLRDDVVFNGHAVAGTRGDPLLAENAARLAL